MTSPGETMDTPCILITGAGSGIGRATARLFAGHDWTVGAFDVDDDAVARARGTFQARRATAAADAAVYERLAGLGSPKRQRLGDGEQTRDA